MQTFKAGPTCNDQRAERPVDQSRGNTAEGLHRVLERISDCTEAGRKIDIFLCSEGPGV